MSHSATDPTNFPQQILALSQQMLDAARDHQWEQVQETDSVRQQLIEQLFSTGAVPDQIELVRKNMEQVVEINRQILLLGEADRDSVSEDIQQFNLGRRARQAYGSNVR